MKIKMLTQVDSGTQVFIKGEIVELPYDKAIEFIGKGYAIPDIEVKPETEKEADVIKSVEGQSPAYPKDRHSRRSRSDGD